MDLIDKKILALLDENSRMQSSELAKKLKTSRQVIDYRIGQLFKKGILLHCNTLIDPFQFVNNVWHTYLKLQSLTEDVEREILSFLQKQEKVWWIAKCQGEWDLIFSTAGNSISDVDIVLQNFRSSFSNFIGEEQTTSFISAKTFPRGYFLNNRTSSQTYVLSGEKQSVDEKDVSILKILATDSRLPATKIALLTGLSPRQVIYRIKELTKKGVIRVFKTHLDLKELNYDYYKVSFFAEQYNTEIENKLISWCEDNSYAVYFVRKISPWNFEIEFETPSYKELNKTLNELRSVFGNVIRRTQTTIITDEFKGELDILNSIN